MESSEGFTSEESTDTAAELDVVWRESAGIARSPVVEGPPIRKAKRPPSPRVAVSLEEVLPFFTLTPVAGAAPSGARSPIVGPKVLSPPVLLTVALTLNPSPASKTKSSESPGGSTAVETTSFGWVSRPKFPAAAPPVAAERAARARRVRRGIVRMEDLPRCRPCPHGGR